MYWRCLLTASVAVGSLYASVALANTDCDFYYEVRRGDTLSKIALRIYGEMDAERLHAANRKAIGRDPALIEIGLKLWIPCRDAAAAAEAPAALETGLALNAPLRVLSGPARAPLIGPDLPETGMMGEMLAAIAARAGFAIEPPAHVPAAGSHLAALLVNGGFDIGVPWTKGDCADGDRNPEQRRACEQLLFTDPFFEVEMGMFTLRDGRFVDAETTADLRGARICRPVALALDDLAAAGLTANAEIVRRDTEAACLEELAAGTVDLVGMDAERGAILLERSALAEKARSLPFTTTQMLYAATPRGRPGAETIIEEVNRGLARIKASGEWFDIAHRHLARYPKLVQRVQPRG